MALPLETLRELVKLANLREKILDRNFQDLKKHVKGGNFLSSDQSEALDLAWDLKELRVFSDDEYEEQIDAHILGIVSSVPASDSPKQLTPPQPPKAPDILPRTKLKSTQQEDVQAAGSQRAGPDRERLAREKPAPVPPAAPDIDPTTPVSEPAPAGGDSDDRSNSDNGDASPTLDSAPVTVVAPAVEPTAPAPEPASSTSDRDFCASAGGIAGIESTDRRACAVTDRGQFGGACCSMVDPASDCGVPDSVENGEACSETKEAPCHVGDAPAPTHAPTPDAAPVASVAPVADHTVPVIPPVVDLTAPLAEPSATVAESTGTVFEPTATADSSHGNSSDGGDGGDDLCTSAGAIPGVELSDGQTCCLASCGLCHGDGCSSVVKDTHCCIPDTLEEDEPCSVKESVPCNIDDGDVPAPKSDEAPVAPVATVVEPTAPASQAVASDDGNGDVPAPKSDEAPVAPVSTVVEPTAFASQAATSDDGNGDSGGDGDDGCDGDVPAPKSDEAPVAPVATVVEPTAPASQAAASDDGNGDSGGDGDDGRDDVRTGAGGIPDIESSNGRAFFPGTFGGDGCSSVVEDTDCRIPDIVEDDESCSVNGSIPCNIDNGNAPASTPDEAPIAPVATVAKPTAPVSQPAPASDVSNDSSSDGDDSGDGRDGTVGELTPTSDSDGDSDSRGSSDSHRSGDSGYDRETEQLERLRQQHKLDRNSAIQAFSESASQASFLAAAKLCTTAIRSFNKLVVEHIEKFGDENGNRRTAADGIERSKISPLLWRRGVAHHHAGRNLSAVKDFETAIRSRCKFKEKNFQRMGAALLRAGDLSEAKKMFQKGLNVKNTVQQNRDCSQGVTHATAVETHVEAGNAALSRSESEEAIRCASKALTLSPNYGEAQELLLTALEQVERWTEARRRCEIWAYKLEACKWMVGDNLELAGFEDGGGPPRVCIRTMHASLQEGYCRALRNDGLRDDFHRALIEANITGVAWARAMSKRRLDAKEKKKLADQAYISNRFNEALDLYSEAIRTDPQDYPANAVLFANRAAVLMNLDRDQEALQDCEEALRRQPDYPKVLERRARLVDRQVDQENTKKKHSQPNAEEAERGPEERQEQAFWMSEDREERACEEGKERRREAEDEEYRREMLRQRVAREERIARLVQEQRRRTEGEEDKRVYEEARRDIPRARHEQEELSREDDDEEERSEISWEDELQRVQQQLQDEVEREQKEREVEHRRAQLRRQKEEMMRFKMAAEKEREAAAKEAEQIRRREDIRREDEEARRVAVFRRAEKEKQAEEQMKREAEAKRAADEEEERRRAEKEIQEEKERQAQEAKKERDRKRKEKKDKRAEPRRRAAAAKKAEEERKAQEQKKEAEMRQKAIEEEKEKRRIERWKREEEEAKLEAARKAEEARVAEERRKAEEQARAEVRKRKEKMRREAKKMKEERARWEAIQKRAAQKEKWKEQQRENRKKQQEWERRAAERRRVAEERAREETRKEYEQERRAAEEEWERRRAWKEASREEERMRTIGRFYDTLGIASNATLQEVKKAHRKLALIHHPDKNRQCKTAESTFREIQEAYETIMEYHNGEESS